MFCRHNANTHHGRNDRNTKFFSKNAQFFFEDIAKEEFTCEHEEWITTLNHYRDTMGKKRNPNPDYVDPAEFIRLLSEQMEDDAVYVPALRSKARRRPYR